MIQQPTHVYRNSTDDGSGCQYGCCQLGQPLCDNQDFLRSGTEEQIDSKRRKNALANKGENVLEKFALLLVDRKGFCSRRLYKVMGNELEITWLK